MQLYENAMHDERRRDYLAPLAVLFSQGIDAPDFFLRGTVLQSYNSVAPADCKLLNAGAAMLLDFGRELHGGVRIVTGGDGGRIRLRFGESASEAMSTPNQDHSIHDTELDCPKMGMLEYGCTGFRFVRIDVLTDGLPLLGVCAVAIYRDLKRIGSFKCSDERLNKIWETGLYTVQLCMQDYIYDGIKRDRLVWLGDLNPELRVVLSVFDDCSILPRSMDFVRNITPLPHFMNSMLSYSCWWIINQYELFLHRGDLDYLREQADYLSGLITIFADMVQADGRVDTGNFPLFLDWPTSVDDTAQKAGGQGLFAWMFHDAAILCDALGLGADANRARDARARVMTYVPDCRGIKSAAAIQTLSGLCDRSNVIIDNPTAGVSTFYGYYMLLAQPVPSALDVIRKYWGAMLDYGATTFWEDFNLDWVQNALPIDRLPVAGKDDLHADFGNFCYKGLRHSLCHGWAGGPTAYLMEKVLGIRVAEPGSRAVIIKPELADLDFAQGTFPTPFGPISVSVTKDGNRDICEAKLPDGIRRL